MANVEQNEKHGQRLQRAGRQPEEKLRGRILAPKQFAPSINRQADQKQRQHAHAERIGRERVKPKAAAHGQQRNGGNAVGHARIDHQGRQKINLRSQQMPKQIRGRLEKHEDKRRRQNQNGMQPAHGSITHTSCSEPRSAASLTRASVANPYSLGRKSTTLQMRMPGGNTPPAPQVTTVWPGPTPLLPER